MQKLSFLLFAFLANATLTFADVSNSTSSSAPSSTSSSPPSSATTTQPTTKHLGENCTSTDICENDAQCWSTDGTSPARCGDFQAKCKADNQCAFETCVDGTCSGLLPLGSSCFWDSQCANGAQCVFVHWSFAFCGGYGAKCNSNSQCANNICIGGTCTGLIALGSPCEKTSQCAKGAICFAQNPGEPTICGNRGASCETKDQCAWDSCIDKICQGDLDLGAPCGSSTDCGGGAQCFSPIKNGSTLCGNTDAKCTSDSQCAFNLCKDGTCSGLYPLGSKCNDRSICQNGAQCFGVNSTVEALCGNYGATCKDDSQCATNTCVSGFCTGTPITNPPNTVTATVTTITTLTTCPSTDICTGQTTIWIGNHGPFPCTAHPTCTCVLPGGTQTVTVCPKSVICTGQTTQWTGNNGPTSCASGVTCNNVLPSQTSSKSTSIQGGGAVRVNGGAEGAMLGLLLAVLGLF